MIKSQKLSHIWHKNVFLRFSWIEEVAEISFELFDLWKGYTKEPISSNESAYA